MKITIRRTTRSVDNFKQRLTTKGAKRLAGGAYACVYQMPKAKNVIKVARNDKAYTNYIKAIIKHPKNPFFPRIRKATEYRTAKQGRYLVVELEKLKARYGMDTWNIASTIRNTCCVHHAVEKDAAESMKQEFDHKKIPVKIKDLEVVYKVLYPLFRNHCADLHEANIMFRDNQPVLTDPVA